MKRRFKEARLQKQMKVIEVAKLFEVAQSTVSAWETERKELWTSKIYTTFKTKQSDFV